MSEENKTLQETVNTVVTEQKPAPQDNENTETEEGMSQETQSAETKAGETADYVSGIDISDIPEQDRPRIKELLEKKAKLLEDGYQPKFQEVAQLKKAQEDLVKMGLSVDEAYGVLDKHVKQRNNPQVTTEKKKEAVKVLDKLLERAADYDNDGKPTGQRQSLEQMRQIILEETNVGELKKEIGDLKTLVKELSGDNVNTKQTKANQFIDELSSTYPKELVEKYRANMVDAHLRYRIPLKRMLQSVVPLDELEQAILKRGKKPLTQAKKEAISSNPSGVTSPTEQIDVKSKSWKDTISTLLKAKK